MTILPHPVGPKLVIHHNPCTPNNDGINDQMQFFIGYLDLSNPRIIIFSLDGRKINELSDVEEGFISWNGRNKQGEVVFPGLYIFVLMEGSRKITTGTIGVAL